VELGREEADLLDPILGHITVTGAGVLPAMRREVT
jgi:hypothetical protein